MEPNTTSKAISSSSVRWRIPGMKFGKADIALRAPPMPGPILLLLLLLRLLRERWQRNRRPKPGWMKARISGRCERRTAKLLAV